MFGRKFGVAKGHEETLFLIPDPVCKCGGESFTYIEVDKKLICKQCGKTYKSPFLRNVLCFLIIVPRLFDEYLRERKEKKERLKNMRKCRVHGLQQTMVLPRNGTEIRVCIKCLAEAMVNPVRHGPPYDESCKDSCLIHGCNCNRSPCTDACLIHGCDH